MKKDLIVPRRLEDRPERYKRIVYKQIQDYIKNGSIGFLNLTGTPIESLPSGLTVNGYLDLENTFIESLPSDLTVEGSLDLDGTKILKLPSGLKVSGNLYIKHTPLSRKYNGVQIRRMIENSGGNIGNEIIY